MWTNRLRAARLTLWQGVSDDDACRCLYADARLCKRRALDPKYGGVSTAIPALAGVVERAGRTQAPIAAFCAQGEQTVPAHLDSLDVTVWPAKRQAWWTDFSLRRRFSQLLAKADGVHIHGLWEQSSTLTASLARRQAA